MKEYIVPISDDHFDKPADDEIAECLTAEPPRSFFLFAGAGSGKTRSLVEVLQKVKISSGQKLRLKGQSVGVITFTNKACDEIKSRIEFDELFQVSTIHHFAWSRIKGYNQDIRECLKISLRNEIDELEEKERKGRAGKASEDRKRKILNKTERLSSLNNIAKFIYNPDGDNPERNALNHSEVIKIASFLLTDKPLLRRLLVNQFPILLIDESQDTNSRLMEALLKVQADMKERFALGIIGDMMQRIYLDGMAGLEKNVPTDWAKPAKKMNHRSSSRIIELINRVREPVDSQIQFPRSDKGAGVVRLFLVSRKYEDKIYIENKIYEKMSAITGDKGWVQTNEENNGKNVKTLILEHHMAANRLGFLDIWGALDNVEKLRTGLRDGSLAGLRFFSHLIFPLVKAYRTNQMFALTAHLRKYSPLMSRSKFEAYGKEQYTHLCSTKNIVHSFMTLWENEKKPSFFHVLQCANEHKLFDIPNDLRPYITKNVEVVGAGDSEEDKNDEVYAWRKFLETSFSQIEAYSEYIQGLSSFDTHQGVKGLEFPRVCVIMDDDEARGFMFSYEKLFGAKAETQKADPSKESTNDRTRRLFYVTCSRAEESLALIAYSSATELVKNHVIREGWFAENEVEILN